MEFQAYLKQKTVRKLRTLAMVILCCLLFGVSDLVAANYTVFGQAFRVTSEELAEKQKAADDAGIPLDVNLLETEGFPFVHIRIYNKTTGNLLAEGDAGINGQYNIPFTFPSPPPGPDIECRVYKSADGEQLLQAEVKAGVNTVNAIGAFNQKKLLVVNDDIFDYVDAPLGSSQGVGLVFSRVGKVVVQYIDQNNTNNGGMADVPAAAPAYIPRFKRAPFGGGLLIFGDFGDPKVLCPGTRIDWYTVTVKNLDTTTSIPLKDTLAKVKTTVNATFPLTITNSTEKLGPFTGEHFTTTGDVEGLYKVNRNAAGVFYSYPDLRMYWNSANQNGLYEITVKYFEEVPGGTPTKPRVMPLTGAACFDPVAPGTPIGKLLVRVNNQPLDVTFDGIFLKNGGYYMVGSSKFDFNTTGLCSIMNLKQLPYQYGIEIDFTANHTGNYMKNYSLSAVSNDQTVNVSFDSQNYTTHVSAADPRWEGTTSTGDTKFKAFGNFPKACAYIIDLTAWSRVQNGYNYIQRIHRRRAYYIDPN
ncbi:MAG: hypothetical protein GY940_21300 [bacterium]|nr:hypothetical protein [bacterium]